MTAEEILTAEVETTSEQQQDLESTERFELQRESNETIKQDASLEAGLADAIHKSVRSGYEAEPSSHCQWVRTVTVSNFKDQIRPILGSAPALELVLEHGEYREGSMIEDSTSYRVEKYVRAHHRVDLGGAGQR